METFKMALPKRIGITQLGEGVGNRTLIFSRSPLQNLSPINASQDTWLDQSKGYALHASSGVHSTCILNPLWHLDICSIAVGGFRTKSGLYVNIFLLLSLD